MSLTCYQVGTSRVTMKPSGIPSDQPCYELNECVEGLLADGQGEWFLSFAEL